MNLTILKLGSSQPIVHTDYKIYNIKNNKITISSSAAGQLEQHTATTSKDPVKLVPQALNGKLQHLFCILKQLPIVSANHGIVPKRNSNQ